MPGPAKCLFRLRADVLRQASSGPTPVRRRRRRAYGRHYGAEKRRAHGDLRPGDGFRKHREHNAPEHRKGGRKKQEIVEQEAPFPGDGRFVLVPAREQWPPLPQEAGGKDHDDCKEIEEHAADRRLGERMHGGNQAAAGQEGAIDAQRKGEDDERHVPDFEHPLLFLDHDRMQERGTREPGKQRGVLNRVPTPVPAPSEDHVGPVTAQELPCTKEKPWPDGPAAGGADPLFVPLPAQKRGHCKRIRYDESHVAEIQHGRVNGHGRMDQQRVHALPVGGLEAEFAEGILPISDQHQEEDLGERHHDGRVGGQRPAEPPGISSGEEIETGQNEGPEEERALHARPYGGEFIGSRQVAAGMAGHIVEVETVVEEKVLEQAEGPQNHNESGGDRAFRAEREIQPAGPTGQNTGHRRVKGGDHREPDEKIADFSHCWSRGSSDDRAFPVSCRGDVLPFEDLSAGQNTGWMLPAIGFLYVFV